MMYDDWMMEPVLQAQQPDAQECPTCRVNGRAAHEAAHAAAQYHPLTAGVAAVPGAMPPPPVPPGYGLVAGAFGGDVRGGGLPTPHGLRGRDVAAAGIGAGVLVALVAVVRWFVSSPRKQGRRSRR